MIFISEEELDCDGGSTCNWTLGFDGSAFHWAIGDNETDGSYTCSGENVEGSTPTGERYSGSWDAARAVLTWESETYIQLDVEA